MTFLQRRGENSHFLPSDETLGVFVVKNVVFNSGIKVKVAFSQVVCCPRYALATKNTFEMQLSTFLPSVNK